MPNQFSSVDFSTDFSGSGAPANPIANIHVGLAAWQQNHAYVLGARISNASAAFQCIIPGTSQSTGTGPAGSGSDIPDGTVHWKWLSAIDFNSIQAWANALPSLLAAPYTGLLWNDGSITTTLGVPVLSLSGHTTSPTNGITLTCAPGESQRDATGPIAFSSTNGVAIVLPSSGSGNTNYIFVADSNVTIDAIQFQDPNSGSHSSIIGVNANNFRLSNSILDGFAQPGPPAGNIVDIQTGCSSFVIDNCLIIDRETAHGSDSHTIECFATTQSGIIVNSTFLAVVNNTVSFAVEVANTNAAGVHVRNCVFFGWTVPLNTLTTVGALAADHCCTDVTSFSGNVTDSGGNLFSRIATNQFINAATDFRLKAGADCVNSGILDLNDIPTSDDIRRTPRPNTGPWDIGMFESGTLVSRLFHIPRSQNPVTIKGAHKLLPNVSDPWSAIFSTAFGPNSANPVVASVSKTKISGNTKLVTLASAELVHFVKAFGLSRLEIASTLSSAFDKEFIRINITSAVLLQVIRVPRAMARSISGRTSQIASAVRLISRLSSLALGASSKALKTADKILSGSGLFIVSIKNLISANRSTRHDQFAAFTNKTIGRGFVSSISQIAFQTRGTTQSIIKLLSSASSEIASLVRNLSAFRSVSISEPQAAASFQGRRSSIIASVLQAYFSTISLASSHIFGTITQQVVAVIRGTIHFTVASSVEVANTLKVVGLHPSALSTASLAIVRVAGKLLGTLSGQLALTAKLVAMSAGAVSSQFATKFFLQAPTKLVTASSAQATSTVKQSNHFAQAVLGATQSIVRASARLLLVTLGYAVSVGGLSAALMKSASVSAAYAISLIRGVGFTKQTVDTQSSQITTKRGFVTVVSVPSSVSRTSAVSITRVTVSPEAVSAGKQGSGKIYTSSIGSTARVVTPRSVMLSAVLSPIAFLTKWFHFFVPQQTGVLLPALDGPAEPPAFSAMDPHDQERLVFDWSARTEPNDPIASVQVVSIPTGMNFVGPIFIEGLQIEVTLGPFTPPELPMTYGLRCSVTFVSGRRSSYTIAIPVRTL